MSALFYSSIVLFDEHSRPQSLNFEDSPAAGRARRLSRQHEDIRAEGRARGKRADLGVLETDLLTNKRKQ